jgi:hypothetical protein
MEDARKRRRALYRVTILVMAGEDGGHVEVQGIPENVDDALNLMSAAQRAVCGMFIRKAMEVGMRAQRGSAVPEGAEDGEWVGDDVPQEAEVGEGEKAEP